MDRKPSIEDRILSRLGKSFLALLSLLAFTVVGYFGTFMLLIGPFLGIIYFVQKVRIDQLAAGDNRKMFTQALFSLPRGIVVGTVVAAALYAPMRGLGFLTAKYSGSDTMLEIFETLSGNSVADAWIGLIGVAFNIPAGFAAWRQGLRMKTQIANIPTSKTNSAALGLAEFKGVSRAIEDRRQRLTEIVVNGEKQAAVPEDLQNEDTERAILFAHDQRSTNDRASRITQIRSRFYLEDHSGRILVDPRNVWFWNGAVEFFSPSARSIYLKNKIDGDTLADIRRLDPGDEIYLIGSVEELEDSPPTATGSERLVVRPSSSLKSTNLLRRIILGKDKKTHGSDIYDVFFLTDAKELKAAEVLTKGIGRIWLWVGIMVCLSVPLLVEYREKLFDWAGLAELVSIW
jgi:hypothetical protein